MIVRTEGAEFVASAAVVTVGAWTRPLLAGLRIALPALTTTEEQVFHFPPLEELPGIIPEPVTETTCLYTATPTEDFVVDRFGPVVVAAGFSGHGFKFTPLIGARRADLALGAVTGRAGRADGARLG